MQRATWTSRLWICAVALIFVAGQGFAEDRLPVHDGVGGDFELPSSLGHDIALADYRGKVVLLFFGYTSCPDICPATLSHLRKLTENLGDAAEQTQVLLVTVDPETDTVERLGDYVARFDPHFVGLSGSRAAVEHVAQLFQAKATRSHGTHVTMKHNRAKAFEDEGFLYAHSQQIYLIDKQGRTRALYFTGTPLTEMERGVRALLRE